jgi:hypothetical protein
VAPPNPEEKKVDTTESNIPCATFESEQTDEEPQHKLVAGKGIVRGG